MNQSTHPLVHPFAFTLDKCIHNDTPYGDNISEGQAPLFGYLGIGSAGDLPSPAYEVMDGDMLDKALVLSLAGLEPFWAVNSAHWVEFVSIDNESIARALYRAITPPEAKDSEYTVEGDGMEAAIHKGTKQVIGYRYYTRGDGFGRIFTVK